MTAPTQTGLTDDTGTPIVLGRGLFVSGEGRLFERDGHPDQVVKLHHTPDRALQRKLDALPILAPNDPSLMPGHVSYAWPISAVRNLHGDAVGCLIPNVAEALTLTSIANPKLRQRRAPWVDLETLHAIAASIAFAVARLHAGGIVIGDIRPENILIAPNGLPTIIDCDSHQIRDAAGGVYPCRVGSEGFTAPEWIGRSFDSDVRLETADRFGLAVLLHQLLTGTHPWTGSWHGKGDPPPRDRLIQEGHWPFRPGSKLQPVPGMVGPDDLAPELAGLFRRAFIAGSSAPQERPTADEWYGAASTALAALVPCERVPSHSHDERLEKCPWCLRAEAGLPDPHRTSAQEKDPWQPALLAVQRALARGDKEHAQSLLEAMPSLLEHEALHATRTVFDDATLLARQTVVMNEQPAATSALEALNQHHPVSESTDVGLEISALPNTEGHADIHYSIDWGWGGLRRPRLQIRVNKTGGFRGKLPGLALVHIPSENLLLKIPSMRGSRPFSETFVSPNQGGMLELRFIGAQATPGIRICHPEKAARTLPSVETVNKYHSKVAFQHSSYFALANVPIHFET